MADTKQVLNLVVLGASFAGVSVVHNLVQHAIPELEASGKFKYRVLCISPSDHLYWNISAPRAVVSSDLITYDQMFVPIANGFKAYPSSLFSWIQGVATKVDTVNRTIFISCPPEQDPAVEYDPENDAAALLDFSDTMVLEYHALILATGSTAHSSLLSLRGPHHLTLSSLMDFQAKLPASDTIIISGGGPSGVETAGQIAYWCNVDKRRNRSKVLTKQQLSILLTNIRHWRQYAFPVKEPATKPKRIILIAGAPSLLPSLDPELGRKAERQLKQLGVQVLTGVRVSEASVRGSDGKTAVSISDGSVLVCDLYVPCTGVTPNCQYLDENLLKDGYAATVDAPSTLRVAVPDHLLPTGRGKTSAITSLYGGPTTEAKSDDNDTDARLYAIGDCAHYSANCIMDIYAAVPVLMQNLVNDLLVWQLMARNPYGGNAEAINDLQRADAVYVKDTRDSQIVPIGYRKPGGIGVVFGYKLPSLMVWLFKGRTYKVERASSVVADGISPY